MRYLLLIFLSLTLSSLVHAEEKLSLYFQNKVAIEKALKIYLAFEARHEIGPGTGGDLNLPNKAKFCSSLGLEKGGWVYPVALGLEIRIGDSQRKVVVISPQPVDGKYFVATDDLVVKSFSKNDLAPILKALEKRRTKLKQTPLD